MVITEITLQEAITERGEVVFLEISLIDLKGNDVINMAASSMTDEK